MGHPNLTPARRPCSQCLHHPDAGDNAQSGPLPRLLPRAAGSSVASRAREHRPPPEPMSCPGSDHLGYHLGPWWMKPPACPCWPAEALPLESAVAPVTPGGGPLAASTAGAMLQGTGVKRCSHPGPGLVSDSPVALGKWQERQPCGHRVHTGLDRAGSLVPFFGGRTLAGCLLDPTAPGSLPGCASELRSGGPGVLG